MDLSPGQLAQRIEPSASDLDVRIASQRSMERTDALYNSIWNTKDSLNRRFAQID